jgi:ADP-heptose:LPS heptosyltransferase
LQAAIDTAPEYHWVSVAWLAEGEEWLAGPPLEGISARYEAGELHTEALFTLIAKADIVLTGPCFMLPLAATFGTPCFVVFGGGVPPNCLIDARMGGRIGHVSPVPGCWCLMNEHACNKEIQPERVAAAFKEFLGCVAR